MSKTTLVMQQVQLQEWFHMMQESKGWPQQIPLDEWCKENYGISAAGYYYRVRKVKEAYLDQVSEEKHQENLAIVPKELFHEDQGVQKNPSKLQTTDSFLDIFQDDLRIRIYENTDEQLLFCVLRNLKNAEWCKRSSSCLYCVWLYRSKKRNRFSFKHHFSNLWDGSFSAWNSVYVLWT